MQQAEVGQNVIEWRCRHCKRLTRKVSWSLNQWPLCVPCFTRAYKRKQEADHV